MPGLVGRAAVRPDENGTRRLGGQACQAGPRQVMWQAWTGEQPRPVVCPGNCGPPAFTENPSQWHGKGRCGVGCRCWKAGLPRHAQRSEHIWQQAWVPGRRSEDSVSRQQPVWYGPGEGWCCVWHGWGVGVGMPADVQAWGLGMSLSRCMNVVRNRGEGRWGA